MKTTLRMYILSLFTFAMATFLLIHFGLIWEYGKFYIYESSRRVLVAETIGIVGIQRVLRTGTIAQAEGR